MSVMSETAIGINDILTQGNKMIAAWREALNDLEALLNLITRASGQKGETDDSIAPEAECKEEPAGTATLTTYMIPYVFYGMADITGIVQPDWLTHGPMGLVNSFCFALIVVAVVGILQKLHLKLKV